MSESLLDENLIATLEQSHRQTRNAQNRLLVRLREVESEAERLRQEIEALENSAQQTEAAIYSLLSTMRPGSKPSGIAKTLRLDDAYESPPEVRRALEGGNRLTEDPISPSPRVDGYPPGGPATEGYGDNSLAYIGKNRGVPSISRNIEPISQRFADRTITQACTLLLRESGKPLHVNELYNFLVAGGFEFKGNNPTISIAVSLNRNRRFRKVAPGTFDLVMRDASQAAS